MKSKEDKARSIVKFVYFAVIIALVVFAECEWLSTGSDIKSLVAITILYFGGGVAIWEFIDKTMKNE